MRYAVIYMYVWNERFIHIYCMYACTYEEKKSYLTEQSATRMHAQIATVE